MEPNEIIDKLKLLGISISRATLTRYEKQELISKSNRGGGGRGIGRWTHYPNEAIYETYAVHCLLSGNYGSDFLKSFFQQKTIPISPKMVGIIRKFNIAYIKLLAINEVFIHEDIPCYVVAHHNKYTAEGYTFLTEYINEIKQEKHNDIVNEACSCYDFKGFKNDVNELMNGTMFINSMLNMEAKKSGLEMNMVVDGRFFQWLFYQWADLFNFAKEKLDP